MIRPHSGLEKATPIGPVKERVTPSDSKCIQFSLKLAWACTVPKVQRKSGTQGLTVEKAVVSIKIFASRA